jgi:hypothetical protein
MSSISNSIFFSIVTGVKWSLLLLLHSPSLMTMMT